MLYILTFLWPHSFSSINLFSFVGERDGLYFTPFSFPFLIASDFLSNCLAAVARYTAQGVVGTGIGCALAAILALAFVIPHVQWLVMDIWTSYVPWNTVRSQSELFALASSSITVFIFPWFLPILSIPPA